MKVITFVKGMIKAYFKAYADAINAEMPDQRELLNEFLKTTLE